MGAFRGSQAWCCGDLDCCGSEVVTVVIAAEGVQMPMCLEHLRSYLVSLGQQLTFSDA